jgi:NAD(P)H-dependent FMN reductase
MMRPVISIVYGSVRSARKGIRAARYLEKKLLERDAEIHFVDPMEYRLPLLDKMYKEYEKGQAPEKMGELSSLLNRSDGFVIVTGEYNQSIPPALKNLLDHFQREYFFKPAAIASYSGGPFGGVRAAVHLRVVLGELGMATISTILPFPRVGDLFNDDLAPKNDIVEKSTARFLDEFFWYVEALKKQREISVPF